MLKWYFGAFQPHFFSGFVFSVRGVILFYYQNNEFIKEATEFFGFFSSEEVVLVVLRAHASVLGHFVFSFAEIGKCPLNHSRVSSVISFLPMYYNAEKWADSTGRWCGKGEIECGWLAWIGRWVAVPWLDGSKTSAGSVLGSPVVVYRRCGVEQQVVTSSAPTPSGALTDAGRLLNKQTFDGSAMDFIERNPPPCEKR